MRADAVLNATDPRFNPPIFNACFRARVTYLDLAATLSEPHPTHPYEECGVKLADYQFARDQDWREAGLLALVGIGIEPGFADLCARYAADHLFSEIDEIGVRDGANLVVEGYDFAPTFSIWTTIEECLNPPLIWEKGRGWFTTEPFSEPEVFEFPEGIGPIECVNVEHEEVVLIPRWVDCKRVTFKYGLGDEFIDVLKTLHKLGLDSTIPVRVRDVEVALRDVVAATLPDPRTLGDRMIGKTCAGTYVTGNGKDGDRGRPTSTTSPTTSGRCGNTAHRPSSGRRRSTRSWRSNCSPKASGPETVSSARRRSRSSRTSTSWRPSARRTACSSSPRKRQRRRLQREPALEEKHRIEPCRWFFFVRRSRKSQAIASSRFRVGTVREVLRDARQDRRPAVAGWVLDERRTDTAAREHLWSTVSWPGERSRSHAADRIHVLPAITGG